MTVTLVVLDSLGVGALPDADAFGDVGAHTLDHTVLKSGVQLFNFARLGLGNVDGVNSIPAASAPLASHGRMVARSPGKDTTTGHWEFMGVVLEHAFKTFPRDHPSFPGRLMEAFDAATGRGHLGNVAASGTEIIAALGAEHVETGKPIVYTSADSVFQVAAHVDVVPLDTLYTWCEAARELLTGEFAVARVIARPFSGEPGDFRRLGGQRRDFSLAPPYPTALNVLRSANKDVVGIGKIPDIYNHCCFTREVPAESNLDVLDKTLAIMAERPSGLVFSNLVEFDSLYGHRRDPQGYAQALAQLDDRLPELLEATAAGDWLLLVSDHGNDPTFHGSDHTREYGLLLAYSPRAPGVSLGTLSSFADVGATACDLLGVPWSGEGASFAPRVLTRGA